MKHWVAALLLVMLLSGCSQSVSKLPVFDPGVDPETWATIPAGEYFRGQHNQPAVVEVGFEMMVTDVTNTQFAAYLNKALAAGEIKIAGDQVVGYYPGDSFQGYKHEEEIKAGDWPHTPLSDPGLRLVFDGQSFSPLAGYENHPMTVVTWFGALAYCQANGGRLPSEMEWEYAARGSDGRPYPWGSELERNQANYYSSRDLFEKIFGQLGGTTPVGFYNGQTYDGYATIQAVSPFGLYDMAGNVWQWTGDVYPKTHYRTLRGGSKADYGYNLRVWTRNSASPSYASVNVGFRCVKSSE